MQWDVSRFKYEAITDDLTKETQSQYKQIAKMFILPVKDFCTLFFLIILLIDCGIPALPEIKEGKGVKSYNCFGFYAHT